MKTLEETTINVHNEEMYIMPYGAFCKEQAESKGMRFCVEGIEGKWKASGSHNDSTLDESFSEIFDTEEEAELRCQEIASNYLNNNADYISTAYDNAKEAASDLYNGGIDLETLSDYELGDKCTEAELEKYISGKMEEEKMY